MSYNQTIMKKKKTNLDLIFCYFLNKYKRRKNKNNLILDVYFNDFEHEFKKKKKIWSLFFFQKLKIDIKLKNAKKYIKYTTYI